MHRRKRPRRMSTQLSDLPSHLLSLILEKLTGEFEDILSCANVCVSWRSMFESININLKRSTPYLILMDKPIKGEADEEEGPPSQRILHIFDPRRNKSHLLHLPQISNRWFHHCSNGWLFIMGSPFPHESRFLNPLSRSDITLPSLGKQFERSFRVITSSSPSDPNCVVLGTLLDPDKAPTLSQDDMVLCRPHDDDQAWTKVTLDSHRVIWHDMILYKNQFFGVSDKFLYGISFDGHAQMLIPLPPNHNAFPPGIQTKTNWYLVQLNGDLILVVMTQKIRGLRTRFKLYKLKFDGEKIWIQIQDLGGSTIYLGRACSVALPSSEKRFRNCAVFFAKYIAHWVNLLPNGGHAMNPYRIPISTRPIQWFAHYEYDRLCS